MSNWNNWSKPDVCSEILHCPWTPSCHFLLAPTIVNRQPLRQRSAMWTLTTLLSHFSNKWGVWHACEYLAFKAVKIAVKFNQAVWEKMFWNFFHDFIYRTIYYYSGTRVRRLDIRLVAENRISSFPKQTVDRTNLLINFDILKMNFLFINYPGYTCV